MSHIDLLARLEPQLPPLVTDALVNERARTALIMRMMSVRSSASSSRGCQSGAL